LKYTQANILVTNISKSALEIYKASFGISTAVVESKGEK
jgi:hypothetical protein